MRTAEQTAIEFLREMLSDPNYDPDTGRGSFVDWISRAIRFDRDQPEHDGTIHAAVIRELTERADSDLFHAAPNERAAAWIEDNPDEFWDRYAGQMLDEIEADFREPEEDA